MNLEANLHSLLSFAWTLTRPTNFNLLRQNIVFSYSQRISVSFSWLIDYFSFFFCYFTLLLIFTKITLLLLFYYIFFHEKYFYFFMFRDVPECSGMFWNVPCSGFYRRPVLQPTFEPVLQQIRLPDLFSWVVKKRNIVIQLVLQPCCKTSCTFFAARLTIGHLH